MGYIVDFREWGGPEAEYGVRRPSGTHRANLHPILALLVLCAVGLSPVEYRGGGERPHAHAVFQLWDDVADGALDHHAEVGVAPGSTGINAAAAAAPPDTPRLTALASAEHASLILVVVVGSVLLTAGSTRGRAVWPSFPILTAHPSAPEPPPPRWVAASA